MNDSDHLDRLWAILAIAKTATPSTHRVHAFSQRDAEALEWLIAEHDRLVGIPIPSLADELATALRSMNVWQQGVRELMPDELSEEVCTVLEKYGAQKKGAKP